MSDLYSDLRILIVDDTAAMRLVLRNMLTTFGCTDIVEASNGDHGWKQLTESQTPVHLILCDILMPVADGISLLKRVRADSRYAKLPVIMVTAEGEKSSIVNAIGAGASAYLVKPVQQEKLDQTIRKVMTKKT